MTPVTEIYDLFLKHLGKDDLLEIDESVLEDLLESYLYVSISNFEQCKQDLAIEDGYFKSELTWKEKQILAKGMLIPFVDTKILNRDALTIHITDSEYSIKSPATLLNNLLKTREMYVKELRKLRIGYATRGVDINE